MAPQSDGALAQLRSLAEPLARSQPPRELILAKLVRPPRGAAARGGLQTENRLLAEASEEMNRVRLEQIERGIAARAVAFVSTDVGADLARLAKADEIALVLTDGRRPLLGEGVPRGDVGTLLREAPGDVAVLVAKERQEVLPSPDARHRRAVRGRGARLGRARAGGVDRLGHRRPADPARRRRPDRRARAGLAPARGRRAARSAVRRHLGPARRGRGRPGGRDRGGRRGRPARGRACPTAGARRASGRHAPRSPARRPPRCCSCAAAPGPAPWRRART